MISCAEGDSILHVAKANKIDIPHLCFHPDFPVKANCRVCVVEIKGQDKLVTSCSTQASDGMEVFTESPKAQKARNTNLELIYAEHVEKCATCVWRFECPLLRYAEKYNLLLTTFRDRKSARKTHRFGNAVEIDGSQCIDCRNCIDACSILQNINYLEMKGKGAGQEVVPTKEKGHHCILCGQCSLHCPVSAAQEQTHWEVVQEALKDKNKIVVAQFAPSIRVSIGEDFGMPHGSIVTGQIVTGLKRLGFDYIFDVSFSADLTTIVEAEELLHRLQNNGKLPMFTSCCPGWINYIEFYHPELIPHITTSRSPHIHGGGVIKTFWAKQMDISPKDIVVVSIMPCTAKKFEASRPEMKINGHFPVDYVLTTRETTFMMKKNQINLAKLKRTPADSPLGEPTGAGVIFGGSGGVMESALRTAHWLACGDKTDGVCRSKVDFKSVRGIDGVKDSVVEVAGKKLRVAVVSGIGHIEEVLDNINKYQYIEVMACPGGCIGGGGQPFPTTPYIRQKRVQALYKLDKGSKRRKSFENKGVAEILDWLKERGRKFEHGVLHTKYKKRIKY